MQLIENFVTGSEIIVILEQKAVFSKKEVWKKLEITLKLSMPILGVRTFERTQKHLR